MKSRGLGRGLSALIPGADDQDSLLMLPLDLLAENPFQPREQMDPEGLRELADSIRENGVIQPIAVCKRDDGYILISGARRVKAARLAGLKTIPSILIEIESDAELLEKALVENLQREDLNPLELANGYQRLVAECGLTQEEIAQKVGKQRPTITNTLRLLKLPEIIKNGIRKGDITAGHAKALISVEDSEKQIELYQRVLREGLNVRKLERIVQKIDSSKPEVKVEKVKNAYLDEYQDRLRAILATKVSIVPRKKGGVIEINYYSDTDLERIMEMLEICDRKEDI